MKISILKQSDRSDWGIKPISLSYLLVPMLFLLPIASIYIAAESAVAVVTCRDVRNTISALKAKKGLAQITLSKYYQRGGNPRGASDLRLRIHLLTMEIENKEKELFYCIEAPGPR